MRKRYLILFAILISASSIVAAQSLPRLEVLKIEIVRVLSDLKLSPRMSNDNVINFSYDGDSYAVEFSEEDENLYFGRLSRYQRYSDEITADMIAHFNSAFNYKTVKVIAEDEGFYIRSEFYFQGKDSFKKVYPHLLQSMSRAWKSLKRTAANYVADSSLVVKTFDPVAVYVDSVATTITALASIEAQYSGNYVLGLRVYRNNTLLCLDESDLDYTRHDTLALDKHNPSVKLSTCVADSLCQEDRLRYELWYKGQCIASEIVTNKIIE